MSFPRYPAYKDSCVEWLKQVPEHWGLVPLWSSATCNDEVLTESTDPETEINYVEISDVDSSGNVLSPSTLLFKDAPSRARRVIRSGDVLVSTVRTYLRAIAPIHSVAEGTIASTGFAVIRPKNIDSRLLGYLCRAEHWISEVIARSVGVSYPAINASELMKLKIPLAPQEEQATIANFLDHETAKIDALIAEQEKLVELLKEKRQAVISHAVTKGLDPNVKMKDSGVEWLGQVPEHWEVVQLKLFLDIRNGADHKPIETEEGHPVYGSGGVFAFASDYIHDGESILLGRKGTIDRPLYVYGKFWTVDTMYWSKINPEAVGKFVYYVCTTIPFNYYSTNTALPSMTKGDLSAHLIGAPTTKEQGEIASFLDHETAKIDTLIAEQTKAVSLLQERRSALISAAVTGQIDVRNFVPEAETA